MAENETFNLGRIVGAGVFTSKETLGNSSTASWWSVDINSVEPKNVKPLVGDSIITGDGKLRKIKSVSDTRVFVEENDGVNLVGPQGPPTDPKVIENINNILSAHNSTFESHDKRITKNATDIAKHELEIENLADGGAIAALANSTTYEQLKLLRNSGELTVGTYYRITDYEATADYVAYNGGTGNEPIAFVESHQFDIVVQATAKNALTTQAFAVKHEFPEGDERNNYFTQDLSKWQLKYSLDNDKSRFAWADEVNGKGVIYELIDERNNRCNYDFKSIKWLNYYMMHAVGGPGSSEGNFPATVFTFDSCKYTFDFTQGGTTGTASRDDSENPDSLCRDNYIDVDISTKKGYNSEGYEDGYSYNIHCPILFGADCHNIETGQNCAALYFCGGCHDIKFGEGCFGVVFNEVTISSSGDSYELCAPCSNITIGDFFCPQEQDFMHYPAKKVNILYYPNRASKCMFCAAANINIGNYCSSISFLNSLNISIGNYCGSIMFGNCKYLTINDYNISIFGASFTIIDLHNCNFSDMAMFRIGGSSYTINGQQIKCFVLDSNGDIVLDQNGNYTYEVTNAINLEFFITENSNYSDMGLGAKLTAYDRNKKSIYTMYFEPDGNNGGFIQVKSYSDLLDDKIKNKADTTYVDTELDKKANSSGTYDSLIAGKAKELSTSDNTKVAAEGLNELNIYYNGPSFINYRGGSNTLYVGNGDGTDTRGALQAGNIYSNNKLVLTDHQDISGKADKTYVDAELAKKQVKGDYAPDRTSRSLVPKGSYIEQDSDLNTAKFLKVGSFWNNADAVVATLKNCPTSHAFTLEVFSILSPNIDNETSSAWVYRLRILTTYTGEQYLQRVSSNGTPGNFSYGSWQQVATTNYVDAGLNAKQDKGNYLTEHQDISWKQNKLTPGDGISIINDTIHAYPQYVLETNDFLNTHHMYFKKPATGVSSPEDFAIWNGYNITYSSKAQVKKSLGVPTNTNQLTNGAGYITNTANAFNYNNLSNKPHLYCHHFIVEARYCRFTGTIISNDSNIINTPQKLNTWLSNNGLTGDNYTSPALQVTGGYRNENASVWGIKYASGSRMVILAVANGQGATTYQEDLSYMRIWDKVRTIL